MKYRTKGIMVVLSALLFISLWIGIVYAVIDNNSSGEDKGKQDVLPGKMSQHKILDEANQSYMKGWPKTTNGIVWSSPTLFDLNRDGTLEVAIGSNDRNLYIWHSDGSNATGWPKITDGNVRSSPAIGDLDGDGQYEIAVGSDDGKLYAWHTDGSIVSGFPKITGSSIHSSPTLGDIDGDGKLEIIVGSLDTKLYAWHNDGSNVPGFPITTGGSIWGTAALGDIDGNGNLEIIVGSLDNKLYAWHSDGSNVPGFPITTGGGIGYSSPVLGDLNGDGQLEIAVSTHDGKLYAWHGDGSNVYGFPISIESFAGDNSPVIGDLDGDGKLEIVVGSTNGKVFALRNDGTYLTGWPITTGGDVRNVALGDLDGDGLLEIVAGSDDGNLYAWHSDGSMVSGFPKIMGSGTDSHPAIDDLDRDGQAEIVIGSDDNKVYAWTVSSRYGRLDWPMFHHDAPHTGLYGWTNLKVTMQAPQGMFNGSMIDYTLYFNNLGDKSALKVLMQDVLSPNVEFISASSGGSYDTGTNKVTWNIDSVNPFSGEARTVTVRIREDAAVNTLIQNTVSISTITSETKYDDNTFFASTNVMERPPGTNFQPFDVWGDQFLIHWDVPFDYAETQFCTSATSAHMEWSINDGQTNPLIIPMKKNRTDSGGSYWIPDPLGPDNPKIKFSLYNRHGQVTELKLVGNGCGSYPEVKNDTTNFYIDPAGWVYDVDNPSLRIAGATVWLQRLDGSHGWKNVPTNQTPPIADPDVNPLITNSAGQYQWYVMNGTYRVHVEAPGYYSNDSIEVDIPPPVQDLHVGLKHLPGSNISGFKIKDTNNNGVWDTGEAGIQGWNITLKNTTTGAVIASNLTDANGFYQFMNLVNGSYYVTEKMKKGFAPTNATSRLITIDGQDIMNLNFTNRPKIVKSSISGFKINDTNDNGKWNKGEKGISNWTIRLIGIIGKGKEAKVIRKKTLTDATGFYKFNNLPPGRYFVIEKFEKGFVPTSSPVRDIKLAYGKKSKNNNFTNRPISSRYKIYDNKDTDYYEAINRDIDKYKEI